MSVNSVNVWEAGRLRGGYGVHRDLGFDHPLTTKTRVILLVAVVILSPPIQRVCLNCSKTSETICRPA